MKTQCTILGQISSVAEGLSPLKTRESCSISNSPVLNKKNSCKDKKKKLLQFFSAFMVIYNVVKEILLIFA